MSKKLKVICDFDGVIVDIMPRWCAELRLSGFVDCYPVYLTEYEMLKNECLLGCTTEQLFGALTRVDYSAVPWVCDVAFYLPQAVSQHSFTFVSCQPVDRDRQMLAKTARLESLVPGAVVNFQSAAENRLDLVGDVLIDDRMDIILAWCERYPDRHGILVNQPYNKAETLPGNATRVVSWSGIALKLHELSTTSELEAGAPAKTAAPKFGIIPQQHRSISLPPLYPSDAKARKAIPLYSGFIAYFPKALGYVNLNKPALHEWQPSFDDLLGQYSEAKAPQHLAAAWHYLINLHTEGEDGLKRDVARVSYLGNKQHSPGQRLHWARGKSMDQLDAAARHEAEHRHGVREDAMGYPVIGQIGWRVMAELQLRLETIEAEAEAGSKS